MSLGPAVDVAVIGGGIVGLATARQLQRIAPGRSVAVLEKEEAVGRHQSGRNSNVLHSGVYYAPGSRKARDCRAGKAEMEAFLAAEGLPHLRCGKLIVATSEDELPRLAELERRARANGAAVERIGAEEIRDREPGVAGLAALAVPESGVTDFGAVCRRLAERIAEAGGRVHLGATLRAVREDAAGVTLSTTTGELRCRVAVNCAGLHSDRVAALAGEVPAARIVPFRGEYFELRPEARSRVGGLVYPVPDPAFPFLGVHLTPTVEGGVHCGPNAVPAFSREGYRWTTVRPADLLASLTWPGTWRLAARYGGTALAELRRSLSRRAFARALARLAPGLEAADLVPAPAGVRAQAVLRDGRLVDDFLVQGSGRFVHVLNAPSPAATASLAIGRAVTAEAEKRMG